MEKATNYHKVLSDVHKAVAPLSLNAREAILGIVVGFIREDLESAIAELVNPPDPEDQASDPEPEVVAYLNGECVGQTFAKDQIIQEWNQLGGVVPVSRVTPQLVKKITARLKIEPVLDEWWKVFTWLQSQDWATGLTDRKWKASLGWLCESDEKFLKYLDQAKAPPATGPPDLVDALTAPDEPNGLPPYLEELEADASQ